METRSQQEPASETHKKSLSSYAKENIITQKISSQKDTSSNARENMVVQKIAPQEDMTSDEEQNSHMFADSDQENVCNLENETPRRDANATRRTYFSSSQWQDMWTSNMEDEEIQQIWNLRTEKPSQRRVMSRWPEDL
ncbi:unnamed protein product [Lasius platythorax]|uniref:Doublesex-and mab-3-related transcription factor a1 n=2 Tax=Lasius TaxID=488720 RepID=A0A0J7K7Y9_LASNI|nr:doublesex- and mab-3-related transcription factor a1 [Lasius niger]